MDSFAKLLMGYDLFKQGLKGEEIAHFADLAEGQSPETLMITCSDSRIDPSYTTQAKPGELFVIRNAGNIVPCCDDAESHADLGTIQFAVEVLKVKHIVVCGHSDCGAVKAMLNQDSVSSLPYLNEWIKRSAKDLKLNPEFSVLENARLNALHQITRLEKLDFVNERIRAGALRLHSWVFNISEAAIETFSFTAAGWVPLIEAVPGVQDTQIVNEEISNQKTEQTLQS